MTNFIPIFPLGIVVYPSEKTNLHIFEPKYKQLIKECKAADKSFGIPVILNNKIQEIGALVNITDIVREYDNGEMDITIQGLKVFRILEIIKQVPDKLYSGAIVSYPDNEENKGDSKLMKVILKGVKSLHNLLNISKEFNKPEEEINAYDLAHHIGLSFGQEYEFLGLFREAHRQEFLKRHLRKVLPMLMEMEQLKEKVKLNGHFRNLSSLDLDIERD